MTPRQIEALRLGLPTDSGLFEVVAGGVPKTTRDDWALRLPTPALNTTAANVVA
jgi:hypothetical protein